MYKSLLTRCFIFVDACFGNICLQKVDCVCFVTDAVEKAIFCEYLVLFYCILGFDRNQDPCLFKQGHFLSYTCGRLPSLKVMINLQPLDVQALNTLSLGYRPSAAITIGKRRYICLLFSLSRIKALSSLSCFSYSWPTGFFTHSEAIEKPNPFPHKILAFSTYPVHVLISFFFFLWGGHS